MSTRPILPGFYPDPSICRVGDTFWLANSSFEYLPGVPIHRSADMVRWEQVGHAYTSSRALPLPGGDAGSLGTFAPTLRHHDGVFYLIVTNMGQQPMAQRITSTTAPERGWSTPVEVPGTPGIDPDLSWDEDGTCYMTWRGMTMGGDAFATAIKAVPIDPATGERLGEETLLWQGTGMRDPEGPRLYRRQGWWYLLLAEGGTGVGHCVTMARARELTGPWEQHPGNPILTHRSTSHPVQAAGHADLVPLDVTATTPDGDWDGARFAMVHLGIRQLEPFPGYHVNGRETFLVGVDWDGDWPTLAEDRYEEAIAARDAAADHAFTTDLHGRPGRVLDDDGAWDLPDRWVSPGGLAHTALARDADGHLTITAPADDAPRPLLATRCRDLSWRAEAELSCASTATGRGEPAAEQGASAAADSATPGTEVELCVYLDPGHRAAVRWDGTRARAVATVAPLEQQLGEEFVVEGDEAGSVHLWIAAEPPQAGVFGKQRPDELVLGARVGDEDRELGRIDGRYLSTEVVGGFTGRVVGVRAVAGTATIERFSYRPL
ncbi:glycoside hydrolase family 43 protein [Actinomyces sp. MRS3W]|uniref:glycoside hydrolase family 43 protein n=1 Tax=Actinomyces sp. MRS3W TaxID=2800796 RepID=UPI0028FD39E9|nr:family 43 glycosylhydrolase [Actinomyces sp. MRS3W]MDU0348588.1 family 43 glycosylhydrolase [Actinomyces sp. MRS3W]